MPKQVSAPNFKLKGSGWYETDFKKDNQRNISKNDNDSDKSKKSPSKVDTSKSEQKTIPSKTKTASNT